MAKPVPQRSSIDSLKERMARDPLSRAFLQLAEEYRRGGQYAEAVGVCLEGLARHPTYHTARIALARTYLEMGDLEGARRTLAETLALAPENHLAGKLLAEVQRKLGDDAGAAATYREILLHYPEDREVAALLRDLSDPAPTLIAAPPPAPPAAASARVEPVSQPPPAAPIRPPAAPARPADPVLEYRSEDLLPRSAAPPPSLPPPPATAPATASAGGDPRDALQTNTLAELYLRQGLVDRALEVYRAMLRVDPGNVRARRRIDELSGAAVPAPAAPAAAPRPSPLADMAEHRVEPAAAPRPAGADARIARLERWLRSMRRTEAGA